MPTSWSLHASFEDRFWQKVKKTDGCWEWTGFKLQGYGIMKGPQIGNIRAHRASWIIHYDEIPEGMWVLHHCDNPQCTRPDHLYLGNQTDNMRDMTSRGRNRMLGNSGRLAGDRNGFSKLTWDEVDEIRMAHTLGIPRRDIAIIYGVSKDSIHSIIGHKGWKECHRPVAA